MNERSVLLAALPLSGSRHLHVIHTRPSQEHRRCGELEGGV
jgi:hypothetical protein